MKQKDLLPKVIDLASAMGKDVDKAAYAVSPCYVRCISRFLNVTKNMGRIL
jgi:hypothetical protein